MFDKFLVIKRSILNWFVGAVPAPVGDPNCDGKGLTCSEHEYVRCDITGCDNNTCTTAELPRGSPCAQYGAIVPAYCDCSSGYFKNKGGICVTRQQCIIERKYC